MEDSEGSGEAEGWGEALESEGARSRGADSEEGAGSWTTEGSGEAEE